MTTIAIRGNLVRPIDIRFTQGGKPVGNAGIAVNRGKDDNKETDFYEVVLWESLAEHAAELEKGTSVIVIGRLVSRQYETRDGQKRTAWEVVADAFGPDLRFARATVTKSNGAHQPQQAPTQDTWGGSNYGDADAPF